MDIHGNAQTSYRENVPRSNVNQRFRFGTAEFNRRKMQLSVDGKAINTQLKPLEILSLLLAHSGSIVTRQMLFDTVWQGRPTVDNVLANAISKLRAALGTHNAAYLITHPRIGYSLDCQVEIINEPTSDKTKLPPALIDNFSRNIFSSFDNFAPLQKYNSLQGWSFFEDPAKSPVILSMSGSFKFSEEIHTSFLERQLDNTIDRDSTTNAQADAVLTCSPGMYSL